MRALIGCCYSDNYGYFVIIISLSFFQKKIHCTKNIVRPKILIVVVSNHILVYYWIMRLEISNRSLASPTDYARFSETL